LAVQADPTLATKDAPMQGNRVVPISDVLAHPATIVPTDLIDRIALIALTGRSIRRARSRVPIKRCPETSRTKTILDVQDTTFPVGRVRSNKL